MANKPKIRFKGFDDAWEQRKLDDVVEFLDTMRKPLEGAKRISGSYPYYGASGIVDYVDGYLFDEELILLSEDGANITDRNYPVCFLASGKYWVNNHAHVLRTKQGNENNFICNSLEQKDYTQYNTGMAMPKLNKETCKKIPVSCPEFKEQKKIGDYFRSLDHLITLHQRNCDQMKELKKYMLTKMFPQNGAKVPEIRFDGFIDDWEQCKLEDVMDTVTDYVAAGSFEDIRNNVTYLNEPGYAQLVRTVDLKKKFTNNDSVYVDESAFKYLWRVNLNDECIVLPNIGANIGEVYFVEPSGLPYDNNVLGPNAILLKANEDTYFAFTALNNLTFQKQLFENVGSSGQPKFNKTKLKSIQLYMPQNEEQVKIGQYFRQLDHLITLHQHKCNELREIKKYMLKNMFI